jgi:hypothetical protein
VSRYFSTLALAALLSSFPQVAQAQVDPVILQYFETPWKEIQARLPEIARIGYTAIWVPPVTKGAEGVKDVGFAVFDRFDLGDKDQRGSVRTKYGTKDELRAFIQQSHRYLIQVFPDTVMNHNSNPSRLEFGGDLEPVPLDEFPGIDPLDFHLLPCRPSGAGVRCKNPPEVGGGSTFQMDPNTPLNEEPTIPCVDAPPGINFPQVDGQNATTLCRAPRVIFDGDLSTFENQHYSLLGLVDFAIEQLVNPGSGPAAGDGQNGTLKVPLPVFVRQPECPECYPNNQPVAEDIREYMIRWIRWVGQELDVDGFRLDAIRHVPEPFYANDFANDPIAFDKAIQDDYDLRRSFPDNNDDDVVDDALIFGESFTGDIFGELARYRATGMLLLNFPLFFNMQALFSNGAGGFGDLGQLSFPHGGDVGALNEFGGMGRKDGVSFIQSHDSLPPDGQPNVAQAFIMTRPGPKVVYFDGNNPDPTNFVQPGRVDSLGDLGSSVITDLVFIHNHFARGGMFNRFVDDDVYVYERVVPGSGATLLVGLTDNITPEFRTDGEGNNRFGEFDARPLLVTAFPPGTTLVDYTGNSATPVVTVLDPNSVPQAARDRALAEFNRSGGGDTPLPANFGLVFLSIPSGPDTGYVAYSVQNPRGPNAPNRAITLIDPATGVEVERTELQTVGTKRTPEGRLIPPVVLDIPRVNPDSTINLRVRSNSAGVVAFARLNEGGVSLGGKPVIVGSPEKLFDGFVQLDEGADFANGDHLFTLEGLDLSDVEEGVHTLTVRVAISRPAPLPPIFTTFVETILISPPSDPDLPNTTPADLDGDGTLNAQDNCSEEFNPNQEDFDGDLVGDMCDLCPVTSPNADVDSDGCRVFSASDLATVETVIAAIRDSVTEPAADLNQDGAVDALDLYLAIEELNQ